MTDTDATTPIDLARRVLETEAQAILGLIPQLGADVRPRARPAAGLRRAASSSPAWASPASSRARSSATLRAPARPAIFLHPAEALHGDLGVVQADDVVIALSYSGETEELVRLLEAIRRIGARLIALTGSPKSTLGQASDVTLSCHVAEEACPMNLAPTASTTATLALGDALAMALSRRKGFRAEALRGPASRRAASASG